MRRHSATTASTFSYCSLPSSVTLYGSEARSITAAICASRSMSASALAADLELEITVAIGGNHLFQAFRQAVVEALAFRVGVGDGVDKAHRMTGEDRVGWFGAGEKLVEIEAGKVGVSAVSMPSLLSRTNAAAETPSSRPSASMMARSIKAVPNDAANH